MIHRKKAKLWAFTLKVIYALWFGGHTIKISENKIYQINIVYFYMVIIYHYFIYPFLFFYLLGMFFDKGFSVLTSFSIAFLVLFFIDILLAFITPIKKLPESKNL